MSKQAIKLKTHFIYKENLIKIESYNHNVWKTKFLHGHVDLGFVAVLNLGAADYFKKTSFLLIFKF